MDTLRALGERLWGLLRLWLPVPLLIWWWKTHPPLFQTGPYQGALNWPIFCLYFACCVAQFGRLLWAWLRN